MASYCDRLDDAPTSTDVGGRLCVCGLETCNGVSVPWEVWNDQNSFNAFESALASLHKRPPAERKARRLGALALLCFLPGGLALVATGYVLTRLIGWVRAARSR